MFSSPAVAAIDYFCPAKINLCLAITGRRADGYHDLVSVVAPVALGDTLSVAPAVRTTLACDDPSLPVDESNLVLKAAHAFRTATGWEGGATFTLRKRIPMGAGLGGGSSDATSALIALNQLAGNPLAPEALAKLAATVGSDCALFLAGGLVVMRGRGERVERLAGSRLNGRKVLIFKPAFSISTPWAYTRLAALATGVGRAPVTGAYISSSAAEDAVGKVAKAAAAGNDLDALLFNSLELPAFEKFAALPTLLGQLQRKFGLAPRMSGSGSACFALLPERVPVAEITAFIRAAWGESAWVVETSVGAV